MTLHLTLKITTAQVVKTSVTNNSFSKDYPHLDNHAKQINDDDDNNNSLLTVYPVAPHLLTNLI